MAISGIPEEEYLLDWAGWLAEGGRGGERQEVQRQRQRIREAVKVPVPVLDE